MKAVAERNNGFRARLSQYNRPKKRHNRTRQPIDFENTQMPDTQSFTLSEAEARRMRRGAFLPILLIAPLAAMFGLDSSKSQPLHFLMTVIVAAIIAAVIVSVSWNGAKRRIAEFSRTHLSIVDRKIIWTTGNRQTELNLQEVTKIDVQETRSEVRTIALLRSGGTTTTLEGYERMNELLDELCQQVDVKVIRTKRWLGIL